MWRSDLITQSTCAKHNSAAPTFTINAQAVQQADGAAWRTALGCAD